MTARVERTDLLQAEAGARAAFREEIERLRPPFLFRCGALLIDYILAIAVVAFTTLFARLTGGGAHVLGDTVEKFGYSAAIIVTLLNCVLLAGLRGQSLGKWATGLRIERTDGAPLSLGRALVRHCVGYPISLLMFGVGFLLPLFNARGRALHDIIAGTVVVRDDVPRSTRPRRTRQR
jgi:uncharacterized RDD family membrane protein YckC